MTFRHFQHFQIRLESYRCKEKDHADFFQNIVKFKFCNPGGITDARKIAKSTPPITGAGMQNLSRTLQRFFKNFPNISTTTATAIV